MMKNILSMAMLSLLASSAFAMSEAPKVLETDIVFTNSTLDTLDVSLSGDASAVQTSYQVAPLATATLAKLTRSSGTNSALNIQLSSDDYQINLSQQTDGTLLAFGAHTDDLSIAPQNEAHIQRFQTQLAGDSNTLAFNGHNLKEGGALTYVLQEEDQKPALGAANQFNLLSYNIWATTIFGSKKVDSRLDEMPAAMAGIINNPVPSKVVESCPIPEISVISCLSCVIRSPSYWLIISALLCLSSDVWVML